MKLTQELIDDYLDGTLSKAQRAQVELWLKSHPADAAKVERERVLNEALAASAPELGAARSKQMWANIKARVEAEKGAAPVPVIILDSEPWYAFFLRPWPGAGFAMAAAAVAVLVWRPWAVAPLARPMDGVPMEAAKASADLAAPAANVASSAGAGASAAREEREEDGSAAKPASRSMSLQASADKKRAKLDEAQPAAEAMIAAAPMAAAAPAAAKAAEPTEVERALADSGVDGMIDAYLAAEKDQRAGTSMAMARRAGPSFGAGASSPLAGFTETVERTEALDSAVLSAAHGGQDNNGFWNWTPAAVALNHHDWTQARLELDAARTKAAESSERAFAASALTLLSAPGAPLAGQGEALPSLGELRVLGAGRWQLLVDSRLARFSEGVSTRLPGFRADGDSLLLDLTFDRGTFAPGTHFTRLAGEAPAEVQDAQGQAFSADEFNAPAGATYNISGRQLKLR